MVTNLLQVQASRLTRPQAVQTNSYLWFHLSVSDRVAEHAAPVCQAQPAHCQPVRASQACAGAPASTLADRLHFPKHLIVCFDRLRSQRRQRSFGSAIGVVSVQAIKVWWGWVQGLLTTCRMPCVFGHGAVAKHCQLAADDIARDICMHACMFIVLGGQQTEF